MVESDMLPDRIELVKERIARACDNNGRDPESVRLLAVTKNHPAEAVQAAIEAGLRLFGENRVQEAMAKYQSIRGDWDLHLIGHLQSNKARDVPGLFGCVESIDSTRIARMIAERAGAASMQIDVLLQLNSSGEESKSGFGSNSELLDAALDIVELPGLRLRGVMTIGPFTQDAAAISKAFRRTRLLYEELQGCLPGESIDILSMGMTDDLEIAVAEGSTEVRIGTAIFGSRM